MRHSESVLIITVLGLIFIICGCFSNNTSEKKTKTYYTFFDTVTYIHSYSNDTDSDFEKNAALAANELEKYHKLLDIYHEYSQVNNLCTVNKNAGVSPVSVDRELIEFLKYAKDLYYLTNGETNIMMGSVLSLWHECRNTGPHSLPDKESLIQASLHTDINLLVIDEKNNTVFITDSEASLDVGAIGKGYAVEKAAQVLENKNISGYVINSGGNIRAIGTKPDGASWVSGIKNPNSDDSTLALRINIENCSCVTSGYYERFFIKDGVRYHHIIDKDSLYPASYYASVSIITKDSGLADALATALFCMPYNEGRALIESIDNAQAIWIFEDNRIEYTNGVSIVKN